MTRRPDLHEYDIALAIEIAFIYERQSATQRRLTRLFLTQTGREIAYGAGSIALMLAIVLSTTSAVAGLACLITAGVCSGLLCERVRAAYLLRLAGIGLASPAPALCEGVSSGVQPGIGQGTGQRTENWTVSKTGEPSPCV